MAVSREQFEPLALCLRVIALALLLTKNALFLLLVLVTGMLIAAISFTFISANRQKALNANLEQQVEARTLQLQASMAELEELNSLQDLLLYSISHDLRTTVMGGLMVLETVQGQAGDMIPVPRELLQRMTQSSKKQLNHLNQLLEAYDNITDGLQLKKERVSMSVVLQEAIADLLPLLQENRTTLLNQISVDSHWMTVDVEKIRQVFYHLVSNAVKHSPPGIEVRLEATLTVSSPKQPAKKPTFQFTITDNGVGIDSHEQKHLFELRLRPPQERQLTRISLGLCLCKQIVTAHGGEIAVHSQVGEGTKIWFTLPIDS